MHRKIYTLGLLPLVLLGMILGCEAPLAPGTPAAKGPHLPLSVPYNFHVALYYQNDGADFSVSVYTSSNGGITLQGPVQTKSMFNNPDTRFSGLGLVPTATLSLQAPPAGSSFYLKFSRNGTFFQGNQIVELKTLQTYKLGSFLVGINNEANASYWVEDYGSRGFAPPPPELKDIFGENYYHYSNGILDYYIINSYDRPFIGRRQSFFQPNGLPGLPTFTVLHYVDQYTEGQFKDPITGKGNPYYSINWNSNDSYPLGSAIYPDDQYPLPAVSEGSLNLTRLGGASAFAGGIEVQLVVKNLPFVDGTVALMAQGTNLLNSDGTPMTYTGQGSPAGAFWNPDTRECTFTFWSAVATGAYTGTVNRDVSLADLNFNLKLYGHSWGGGILVNCREALNTGDPAGTFYVNARQALGLQNGDRVRIVLDANLR